MQSYAFFVVPAKQAPCSAPARSSSEREPNHRPFRLNAWSIIACNNWALGLWVPAFAGTTPFDEAALATNSPERRLHPSQSLEFHDHAIACLEPDRLHQAPRQHDLSGMQPLALFGQMIGEPGKRVMRMTEHVSASAAASLRAVDQSATGDLKEIGRGVACDRLTQNAAGGKEIVGDQGRRADRLPYLAAVADAPARREIGLNRLPHPLGRERLLARRKIAR